MDTLLRRREIIAVSGGTHPTPPPVLDEYVQDGLVLHLDGIEKGITPGRWTSLVGSTYYDLTEHSTEELDAVVMDGAGYLTATNPVNVTYTTGTIEVCIELLDSNKCVIVYGPSDSIACQFGNKVSFGVKSPAASNSWDITTIPSLFTLSMNSNLCYLNGSATGTHTQEGWGAGADTVHTIGGRNYGTNKYYANVRIHSIRIYNRKLTASEILQNQQADNTRFNLGF